MYAYLPGSCNVEDCSPARPSSAEKMVWRQDPDIPRWRLLLLLPHDKCDTPTGGSYGNGRRAAKVLGCGYAPRCEPRWRILLRRLHYGRVLSAIVCGEAAAAGECHVLPQRGGS